MSKASHDLCIAYYSRSGHSRRLAANLAVELHTDLIEITAPAYAGGLLGYMRAGYDSLRQKGALEPQSFTSLADYQHVILVGPVWTSYPAAPLRALMRSGDKLPLAVSIFLTSGGHSTQESAFAAAISDLGRHFVATGVLANADEGTAQEDRAIATFLPELKEPSALAK
jgi:flavodoxin